MYNKKVNRAYVAAKFEEKAAAREVMVELGKLGIGITHDWTVFEESVSDKSECAVHDANGVLSSDFLVVVAKKDLEYRGSYVEFGMALGVNIPVFLLGTGMDKCIFSNHPSVIKFKNMGGLIKHIKKNYRTV